MPGAVFGAGRAAENGGGCPRGVSSLRGRTAVLGAADTAVASLLHSLTEAPEDPVRVCP